MKKMFVSLLLAAAMMVALSTAAMAADVKIVIDGTQIGSDVKPVLENGSTLVPARAVFQSLGARVDWNNSTRKMTVKTAANEVVVTINASTASVNGVSKTLDAPAKIVDSRTLVPLRFISEAIGAAVDWNGTANTVTITYFSNMEGTLKIGGSTTVQPPAQGIADKLMSINDGLSVTVVGGGSGAGVKGAASGEFNIGNASRALKDSEKTEYPDLVSYQIGSDGIAVIVHKDNPITELSKQQIYDIFTGKTTNWADAGGNKAPIFVQSREATSGTLGAFKELALEEISEDAEIVSTAVEHASNGLVKQAVAADENAIGFISFGYLDDSVKGVKVEAIDATVDNALNGSWPYVRPLNVCTKGNAGGIAAKFIDFYRTPQGKKILEDSNYMAMK